LQKLVPTDLAGDAARFGQRRVFEIGIDNDAPLAVSGNLARQD